MSKKIISTIGTDAYSKSPFQHCVVDDAFDVELLKVVTQRSMIVIIVNGTIKMTLTLDQEWIKLESEMDIPDGILIVRVFNSAIVLRAISEIFGIPKLIPDPYFSGGV